VVPGDEVWHTIPRPAPRGVGGFLGEAPTLLRTYTSQIGMEKIFHAKERFSILPEFLCRAWYRMRTCRVYMMA
jgi:hypothetical protein